MTADAPDRRASRIFRVLLARELPPLVRDGVLDESAAERLAEHYELDGLERESSFQVANVIFIIGGLLIGGGVLAFVAANWAGLPIVLKVMILFAALLGLHGTGLWLWERRDSPRLGHALIVTGCLVFGADLGLMAQVFHVRESWQAIFGAWALGVVAVAWAVKSSVAGLLAVVVSFTWFAGSLVEDPHAFPAYPFLLAVVVLPLAHVARSAMLHGFTMLAIAVATVTVAGVDAEEAWAFFSAACVVSFLLWSVGQHDRARSHGGGLAGASVSFGVLGLSFVAYLLSFHDLAKDAGGGLAEGWQWLWPTAVALLVAVALLAACWRARAAQGGPAVLRLGPVASMALLAVAVLLLQEHRAAIAVAVLANLAALGLAGTGVSAGLVSEKRWPFWLGTTFAVLLVVSRFLEYQTSLLTKSAVFTVAGVVLIWASVQFERHVRRREAAP